MTRQPVVQRSAIGLRSERGPILAALMLSTGLVAIDSTVIATAVPSIVRSVHGFADFPWLFSIYLLAQAVTVPVYGKLADHFGRKPIMLTGIALFFTGSVACGVAWSMPALICFRLVQGLGAGAVQPMSMTIVGDLYTLQERARVQGYIASVWGVSAVVGPTLGGALSQYANWRWIFFVNVPLCVIAASMIGRHFHEKVERRESTIDRRGAVLLTLGLSLLILGVLEGGQAWSWTSPTSVTVLTAGSVLLIVLTFLERHVSDPIIPAWLLRNRLIATTSGIAAAVGAILLGLSSYVPTYAQDALGTGPVVAGLALAALTIGWPLSAAQSGRLYLRIGFRATAMWGTSLIVLGTLLLLLLGQHSSIYQVAGTCFVIGAGMGLTASPSLVAAQSAVQWQQRGLVTGTNMFFRSTGSAVGVAIFGAIANASLGLSMVHSGDVKPDALTHAVHHVFIATVAFAALLAAAVTLMPRVSRTASDRD